MVGMNMRDDRGSATVWTLALMTVLLVAGCLAMTVAQIALARQRLSSAADLAALAAAQQPATGCARAAHFANANGVGFGSCHFDGVDHWIEVWLPAPTLAVRMAALLGEQAPDLRVIARAGPALGPGVP
jgi:secretion/DNA translocation related TadE-like protein